MTVTGETDVTDVMDDGQDENAYVETNVFLQDRQQQESDVSGVCDKKKLVTKALGVSHCIYKSPYTMEGI